MILWNKDHRSYLRDLLILSEAENCCFYKFIPEALPSLEAPLVVCLVHLYKLLCGITFDRSSYSIALPLRLSLRQEKVKTGMEKTERIFVADAPVERGVRPTSSKPVRPSAGVRCDLPLNNPTFLVVSMNCITQTSHCS
jgi:hypothetical protein